MNFTRTKSFTPVLITTFTLLLKCNMHYENPITKAGNLITVFQLQVFTGMFFVTCFFSKWKLLYFITSKIRMNQLVSLYCIIHGNVSFNMTVSEPEF